MNLVLEDETTSINAIFAPDTLTKPSDNNNDTAYTLQIPSHSVRLRLNFPSSYPDAPPTILGPESAGSDLRKGEASRFAEEARQALCRVFEPGEPCIYDLIEEVASSAHSRGNEDDTHGGEEEEEGEGEIHHAEQLHNLHERDGNTTPQYPDPDFTLSSPVTEKGSVFLARAAAAHTPEQARHAIARLKQTDKKASRATHNITAWRLRRRVQAGAAEPVEVVQHDCNDDGEAAAGGRLLHLLEMMGAWDVVVVVSRWYGGVKLGPDRFRIIGSVAREVLIAGGFAGSGKGG